MPPRCRWILASIWLIFLIRGAFYCGLIPLWEGFDEWAHYGFIEHVRLHPGVLPRTTDRVTEEIRQSVQSQAIRHESADPMMLFEAQQPPLYYWILSVPNRLMIGWPIADRVHWLRLFGILIASLAIPFGYLAAFEMFRSRALALSACALIASMPGLMIDISRISNDVLGVAIASWIIFLLVRDKASALGIAMGMGLLTKAYFLAFIPFLILRRRFFSLVTAVVVAGWWYWRNFRLTGTWTGEIMDVAIRKSGWTAKFAAIGQQNWLKTFDSAVWTHIWIGAWSFFSLRSWMYRIFEVVFAVVAIAVIYAIFKRPLGRFKRKLALTCSMELFFALGIAYQALAIFMEKNISFAPGWYFYALVDAEAILLAAGALIAAGKRRVLLTMTCLTALYVTLDLYTSTFVLARHYSAHVSVIYAIATIALVILSAVL